MEEDISTKDMKQPEANSTPLYSPYATTTAMEPTLSQPLPETLSPEPTFLAMVMARPKVVLRRLAPLPTRSAGLRSLTHNASTPIFLPPSKPLLPMESTCYQLPLVEQPTNISTIHLLSPPSSPFNEAFSLSSLVAIPVLSQ